MEKLMGDVKAVIRHFGRDKAVVVGHDWGGMVAWSFEGMLNYYKANYPDEPYAVPGDDGPRIQCPVLMFHGLKDKALLAGALNDTWRWLDKDLTLVTIPDADHFVQQDAPELVTRTMVEWLKR